MARYKQLKSYGLIGNLETCALVGKDGAVEWLCWPRLDAPSVFASLLDLEVGGHFRIRPCGSYASLQRYREDTNVLETTFETATGRLVLVDFMPVQTGNEERPLRALLRRVRVEDGAVRLELGFRPRFDYARGHTRLEVTGNSVRAWQGEQALRLDGPEGLVLKDLADGSQEVQGRWLLTQGEDLWFVLQDDAAAALSEPECERLLNRDLSFWRRWVRRPPQLPCLERNPYREIVQRSALALKLLCCDPEGGIAAAPTTSLPEEIGGVRNWDYRYAWIRDSSFTVQALYDLGFIEEARRHLHWFRAVCKEVTHPSELRVMYGLDRRPAPPEQNLNHLEGYRGSKPVRIGNGAVDQLQLDIYGELVNAFYETVRYDKELNQEDWDWVRRLTDYVCEAWTLPDAGIWEVRSEPRHHTYSKLMCWVALDRSIRLAEERGFDAPLDTWRTVRQDIREAILTQGFSPRLNAFVQYFGGEELDATSLLIPVLEFLPPEDPRVQGTLEATLQHLTHDGLVQRYGSGTDDGLTGGEGAFILCSFWLVDALAISGRMQEAEALFDHLLDYASPLGLIAEEVDLRTGELLGNFPQAYSHVGLINSVLYLCRFRLTGATPDPVGTPQRTREKLAQSGENLRSQP
ncbi:GH15 family glucan-1,4-alpha-glucosidase [Deinobacterium chartae]|uniref:GH15 family glucan-1,4-alpha-glucosidase n=1 Tax=Deinobacterium chartae TaxID=521158 RepID=A0A841I1A4_9DEIO|nr:glycoside hydrolase family 15 protein [Deinobacterium chartae]MBB6098210.1 GH15 family glucan-1,4-alpha-glucosidase [Deinobacterium chartae]